MVILDKKLRLVRWFNSKKETPNLKSGEFIEKDEAVPFVFFLGEKIITNPSHLTEEQIQKYLDKGYEMSDRFSLNWYDSRSKNELYVEKGKVISKTNEMLLEEAKEKLINIKINELAKDNLKIIDGTAKKELDSYRDKINKITSLEELKNNEGGI